MDFRPNFDLLSSWGGVVLLVGKVMGSSPTGYRVIYQVKEEEAIL